MQTGEEKRAARTRALARRAEAFAAHGATAGESLAAHGLAFLQTAPGAIVSGFSAIRDEIDPAALLARLGAAGYRLCLPVMQGKGIAARLSRLERRAMRWARCNGASPSRCPTSRCSSPTSCWCRCSPSMPRGYRLGYGGGFYDRTLARLRAIKPVVAVGVAYDELKVDAVPHQVYDQPPRLGADAVRPAALLSGT